MKGASGDKLVKMIKSLKEKELITKDIADWATVIRWLGNDAVHANIESVEKDESEDCLELTEQFLHVLFVAPAIAEQRAKLRSK